MLEAVKTNEGQNIAPQLYPAKFINGCNTTEEQIHRQSEINLKHDIPWLTPEPLKDKPLVIVGSGPSLKHRYGEISSHNGDVMALNNSYSFLLEIGIKPNYFMLLDAREQNLEFVRDASHGVIHYLASQVHPSVYEFLYGFDVRLYLTSTKNIIELIEPYSKPKVLIGGQVGTVGMKSISLGYALGYREFHLYGYDSSYTDLHHHAFPQVLNDTSKTFDAYLGDKKYITTPAMAHQAQEFCGAVKELMELGCTFELHCSGLLPDMVSVCNTLGDTP